MGVGYRQVGELDDLDFILFHRTADEYPARFIGFQEAVEDFRQGHMRGAVDHEPISAAAFGIDADQHQRGDEVGVLQSAVGEQHGAVAEPGELFLDRLPGIVFQRRYSHRRPFHGDKNTFSLAGFHGFPL